MAASAWTPVDETEAQWTRVDETPVEKPRSLADRIRQGATLKEAMDPYVGFAKGAGQTAATAASLLNKVPVVGEYLAPSAGVEAFQQAMKPRNAAQQVGKFAEGIGEAAIPIGGAEKAAANALPSTARAGEAFQGVMKAAKDAPLPWTSQLAGSLNRYQELVDAGGSRSLAIQKLLNRVTKPGSPLTYGEARDFYSNISRLSADEFMRLTPVMKQQVGAIRVALNDAIKEAASAAGKGATYEAAMKEYASAARIKQVAADFGAYTWQQAKEKLPWLIVGYGAKQVYDALK